VRNAKAFHSPPDSLRHNQRTRAVSIRQYEGKLSYS
jgi:hypothetical protein